MASMHDARPDGSCATQEAQTWSPPPRRRASRDGRDRRGATAEGRERGFNCARCPLINAPSYRFDYHTNGRALSVVSLRKTLRRTVPQTRRCPRRGEGGPQARRASRVAMAVAVRREVPPPTGCPRAAALPCVVAPSAWTELSLGRPRSAVASAGCCARGCCARSAYPGMHAKALLRSMTAWPAGVGPVHGRCTAGVRPE